LLNIPASGAEFTPPINDGRKLAGEVGSMSEEIKKTWWRAFLDFFVLFNGVSTASNLSRAQGRRISLRGLFLFRKPSAEDKQRPENSPGNKLGSR
jgi:hypothetical protein